MTSELQRIANILGIKSNVEESRLCLLIQDKIKEKDKNIKKNDFCYQIHNLNNEYAECIGIHEHIIVKQSIDVIKKQLNKALEDNHKLNETIRKYKEREFKDRLNKIEGVRQSV